MQGVKEDRYGGEGLPTFFMEARTTTRMTGGPSTAITKAMVEAGGSARTKQSKRDSPPQAWTIPAVPLASGRGCGLTCTLDWAGEDGVCVCVFPASGYNWVTVSA